MDAASCANPAVDDPESWDCECADTMEKACNTAPEYIGWSLDCCFKDMMCKHSNICSSWKNGVPGVSQGACENGEAPASCRPSMIQQNATKAYADSLIQQLEVRANGELLAQRSTQANRLENGLDSSLSAK